MNNNPTLSIIIKTYNEEKNIDRCLKSIIKASKDVKAEIILADSLSTDKTLDIAKKYPIKIVQLRNPEDRSCGIGNQLGYQHSKGKYIIILDGDMEIYSAFLKKLIDKLEKNNQLAGIGGKIKEMNIKNMEFMKKSKKINSTKGYVKYLNTGSIYRRKAIEEVGYLSNLNLHSFEELDLGLRLNSKNWKLERINSVFIKHYGHTDKTLGLALKRIKTKYVYGYGELIRSSFGKSYFLSTLWNAKIQLGIISIWIVSLLLAFSNYIVAAIALPLAVIIFMMAKKLSIKEALYSIFIWHIDIIGLVFGFFKKQKNPYEKINAKIIK